MSAATGKALGYAGSGNAMDHRSSSPRMTTARTSHRLRTMLRAAAPLAAMFLLTGAALVSCEGDPESGSNGGGSTTPGSRPNSAAMGRWTPVTDVDTCTQAFHDTYFVIGPDGKKYPTWHPPSATDPATSRLCTFGHEHGRDPRGSLLWDSLRTHYAYDLNGNGTIDTAERDASGVPFGYAAEQLRAFNSANGLGNADRVQSHVAYKIAWENGIARTRTLNGQAQTFDLSCDALTMLNQDTHSADAFASNLHEVIYAIDCSRGTDAPTYGGKVTLSVMATFGNPGEFAVAQADGTYTTLRFGTPQPASSPNGGTERGRVIPVAEDVYAAVLVPFGQTSDFAAAMTEIWYAGVTLTRTDGSELVFVDPAFTVSSASRFFDVARFDGVGRTIDLCYIGISANGFLVDDPLQAAAIVRRARGPECQAIAPLGPATLRIDRVPFDDPLSPFNGCRRSIDLGLTRVTNAGGATLWYSDPYGRATRAATFTGGVRQYVGTINNSATTGLDRATFGADVDPCLTGSSIHAPN